MLGHGFTDWITLSKQLVTISPVDLSPVCWSVELTGMGTSIIFLLFFVRGVKEGHCN